MKTELAIGVWQASEEEDMLEYINSFALDEDGAVTVDWVILAAGVVSLALAAVGVITDGTGDLSGDIYQSLQGQPIATEFSQDGNL